MKLNRRSFLIKLFSGMGALFFIDSFWFERYFIEWTQFDISKENMDKVKVIQLSDLHLEGIKSFHRSIAERINSEKPDLLLFTGDTINGNYGLPILRELLNLIAKDIPKMAIMGNKEYWGNTDIGQLKDLLGGYNGKLLINQNIEFKKGKRKLAIMGLDDFVGGNPDFDIASKNIDRETDTLILNHCPVYCETIAAIDKTANLRIRAVLSGHTHGGQITFFGMALFTPYGSGRYVRGWYTVGNLRMYVSKGVGTRILPLRFWSRAEATIFYL